MRQIDKQPCIPLAEACATPDSSPHDWDDLHKNHRELYVRMRQQAEEEQHGECAYTGLLVSERNGHLDHFRKRALYPQLMFEWDNIFLAVKCGKYGADHKDHIINGNNHTAMYARLLMPLTEEVERYFYYANDGSIQPSPDLSDDDRERAQLTIDTFNLNEATLCQRRSGIQKRIESILNGCPGAKAQQLFEIFNGTPFSAMVRQYISTRLPSLTT